MRVSGTFDVECAEWSRFIVATTYEPMHGTTVHRTKEALADYLLKSPGRTWWAHAGGVYDCLLVAEEFRRRGIPTSGEQAGARMSRVLGGAIVLRDSWPLIPLPLSKAVELIGENQAQWDPALLPCSCYEPCGGACSLVRAFSSREVYDHVTERCASDSRQLFALLRRIERIGAEMDLDMRGTIGGTAWSTAKRRLGLPDAKHSPSEWRTLRKAYFGGRSCIVRPVAKSGSHFDISSCYPWALANTQLPTGNPETLIGLAARDALESDKHGIFSATVSVPDLFIPPLPLRQPKRVAYPVGVFRGVWTGIELRAAINRGVTVESVRWAEVWPSSETPFRPLVQEWWEARRKAGKDSALGAWLRLLMNAPTGKLAENPHKRVMKMYPDIIRVCEGKRPCSPRRCTGACGAYTQLDEWGHIYSVPIFRPSSCSHIEWAAHLTAAARIELLRGMESQGVNLVQSLTDSVWTTSNDPPGKVGSGLGEWEHKEDFSDFDCAAPGQYSYTSLGKRTVKTAGILINSQDYGRGFAKNDRGVLSFTEAAATRKGLFVRRNQNWTLSTRGKESGWYGDRRLDHRTGITYPMRMQHGDQEEAD